MIRIAIASELSQQRNDATTYFTCSNISHWELFLQNRPGELFPPIVASMFVTLKRNRKSVIEILWDEVFIVRNKVKKENLDVQKTEFQSY